MNAQPLLLTEGTPDLRLQVLDARFMGPATAGEKLYNPDAIMACGIITAGVRETINPYLRGFPRLGCFEISTPTLSASMAGDFDDWTSYVLFAPRRMAFEGAYRIARKLRHANPGRAALLTSFDFCGSSVFLIHGHFHAICVDGERIGE